MLEAAKEILPTIPVQRKRPWISTRTLHLIEERNQERTDGANTDTVKRLNKQIQLSARADRKHWLDEAITQNGWQAVRALRKGRPMKHGRLRDSEGNLVDSEMRAETMANYLEREQWKLCHDSEPLPNLEEDAGFLHIDVGNITLEEVQRAVKALKVQKAAGSDGVPPDLWHALWRDSAALEIL